MHHFMSNTGVHKNIISQNNKTRPNRGATAASATTSGGRQVSNYLVKCLND